MSSRKEIAYIEPSFFADYSFPNTDSALDADIAQLANLDVDFVKTDHEHACRLINQYLCGLPIEKIYEMAHLWFLKPGKLFLWVYTSSSIEDAIQRFTTSVSAPEGTVHLDDDKLIITAETDVFGEGVSSFSVCFYTIMMKQILLDEVEIAVGVSDELRNVGNFLQTHLDVRVEFGVSSNYISARCPNLKCMPMKTSNEVLEELLRPALTYADFEDQHRLEHMARLHIRDNLANPDLALGDLAKLLNVSRRTLQRKLSDAKTSFRAIREDERLKLALECRSAGISIGQIADLIGYADINSVYKLLEKSR